MYWTKKTEAIDIQKPSTVCCMYRIMSDKKVLAIDVGNEL